MKVCDAGGLVKVDLWVRVFRSTKDSFLASAIRDYNERVEVLPQKQKGDLLEMPRNKSWSLTGLLNRLLSLGMFKSKKAWMILLVYKCGCLDRLLGNWYASIVCSETHWKWKKKGTVGFCQGIICTIFETNKVWKSKVVWKSCNDPVTSPPLTHLLKFFRAL